MSKNHETPADQGSGAQSGSVEYTPEELSEMVAMCGILIWSEPGGTDHDAAMNAIGEIVMAADARLLTDAQIYWALR